MHTNNTFEKKSIERCYSLKSMINRILLHNATLYKGLGKGFFVFKGSQKPYLFLTRFNKQDINQHLSVRIIAFGKVNKIYVFQAL